MKLYGSVYFDVKNSTKSYEYGKLSGGNWKIDCPNTREFGRNRTKKRVHKILPYGKRFEVQHIMRWPSPGEMFSRWHLACTAMKHKILERNFDIQMVAVMDP